MSVRVSVCMHVQEKGMISGEDLTTFKGQLCGHSTNIPPAWQVSTYSERSFMGRMENMTAHFCAQRHRSIPTEKEKKKRNLTQIADC